MSHSPAHPIRFLSALCLCLCCACASPPPTSAPRTTHPAATAPAIAALPSGVLAQASGTGGVIRVEDRGDLRVLTIDGVVQGAVPRVARGTEPADAIAPLLRAFRPAARSVLLIGLGTGSTARALTSAGFTPVVVEIEPAVAEFAKRYFGYEGAVVVDDGLAYASRSNRAFDVVVLDAGTGAGTDERVMTSQSLDAFRARLAPDGVLAIRTLGAPDAAEPVALFGRLGMPMQLMFGTGVGSERQNLLLLGSGSSLHAEDLSGVAAWPVVIPGSASERTPLFGAPREPHGSARDVELVGYLIRTDDGTLCLDLPHWEMGAIRYVIGGSERDRLMALLPAKTRFPTDGDIRSDGDKSRTMYSLLGGGGAKRSDVRFSPVTVGVRGVARLRSVSHPDDRWVAGGEGRVHPLLPYGGALYELEVASVLWSYDFARWDALRKRELATRVAKATSAARAGEIGGAVDALEAYEAGMRRGLGDAATDMPAMREIRSLAAALRIEVARPSTSAFGNAAACDRAASSTRAWSVNPDVPPVRDALLACAVQQYDEAFRNAVDAEARHAAARLLHLLDDDPSLSRFARAATPRAIDKRFPSLEPAREPPP